MPSVGVTRRESRRRSEVLLRGYQSLTQERKSAGRGAGKASTSRTDTNVGLSPRNHDAHPAPDGPISSVRVPAVALPEMDDKMRFVNVFPVLGFLAGTSKLSPLHSRAAPGFFDEGAGDAILAGCGDN